MYVCICIYVYMCVSEPQIHSLGGSQGSSVEKRWLPCHLVCFLLLSLIPTPGPLLLPFSEGNIRLGEEGGHLQGLRKSASEGCEGQKGEQVDKRMSS